MSKSRYLKSSLLLSGILVLIMVGSVFAENGSKQSFENQNNVNLNQRYGMTWSGRVDDVARITIRGRSATTRRVTGQGVSNTRYNFYSTLPRRSVNVRVRKRDGRGRITVIRQPSRRNGYTAVIEIRDSKGGSDNYRFELSWDNDGYRDNRNDDWNDRNRDRDRNDGRSGSMTWSGTVDDTVHIRVSRRRASVRSIRGSSPRRVRTNFNSSLPRRSVRVDVNKRDGRGSVRVIEQPRRSNGYTALIEIRDRSSGRDYYSFELNWDSRSRGWNDRDDRDWGGNDDWNNDRRNVGMTWRGRVDDTIEIAIRGRYAQTRTTRGQRHRSVRYNFATSLPRRSMRVYVNKRDGRGRISVVQQPSRRNNYTAIIRIRDSSGGSDNYTFDLTW